ncbi:hypothetical protein G7Y89_g14448 [Cudoniella acicularis]|uniref:NmrA-like domain-containing protein n=1 Tax=Cudoniella acicularis TaxID=354080 RepID=A0A8H4VTH1_9HELO|nr:hypothetical protein G7Y89_g14448 [Cudoniella acicularis]
MAPVNTIIFGPTGAVGSAAARTAQQHGAKVILAMRDTQKSIPQLTPAQEKSGGFERIQADLTKLDTITAAVTKSGAKHAFLYLDFHSSDGMRSVIETLKSAGIKLVVFLSSGGVMRRDLESIPPSEFISYSHARVEINLREVFGPQGYIAVRPFYFSSNTKQWVSMIKAGEVKLLHPEVVFDFISPEDIGVVCGIFAAGGLKAADGKNEIELCGPEQMSQGDAVGVIAKVLGKDIKVTEVGEEEALQVFITESKFPEMMAKQLVYIINSGVGDGVGARLYVGEEYQEATGNILKYGGKKPEGFEEWVAQNKHEFV